jgi:LPXTG-motif cell wall-anchored protein
MKKLIITTAILLGLSLTTFADGGLFQRGYNAKNGQSGYNLYFNAKNTASEDVATPLLPPHGEDNNMAAPLGGGIAVLMGLGAAYMVAKKRKD